MENKFSLCYYHYPIESFSSSFKLNIYDYNKTGTQHELYENHLKFLALINLVYNLDDYIFRY